MADWLTSLVARAHEALESPAGAEARDYLTCRGVTEAERGLHHLGFTSDDLPIETCTQAFLDWYPKYFYGRLLFPFYDARGGLTGFQTRTLDRKYYAQFFAYPTDITPYFFGLRPALDALWTTGQLVIVEGVFDYFAVSKVVPNVAAILTGSPSGPCRQFFRRYVTHLTALLDMDEAGRQGVERLLRDPERTYLVTAPAYPAHDPADLVAAGGLGFLQHLLRGLQLLPEKQV